ncbi:hypothetical protein GFB56_15595 [Ensifer sp. T173]|uniref:Uncharacterized protein n=1 Tax=Ensifer canadensis TaxID=555315 RepID=A0AAW4FM32_9HYPH|nr:hypothetical protein [Ensifer canadensis]MBM3092229.1 hypothetical protein [Ensifer canadensis]UBI73953.1 hypothetical protein J3R84_10480 [Ensifer canadensis]
MLDFFSISGIKFGLDTLRGVWRFFRGNRRDLTPAKRLELRQKWKPKFEDFFRVNTHKELSTQVIIRNISRLDDYPDSTKPKKKQGISPWFKVPVVQTYERGFMVCLSIGELVSIGEDKWRYRDWLKGEDGEKFWCIGFIPYEGIVDVDWEGDKYYDYPHVVCHFDQAKRQPYERIMLCREWKFDKTSHFTEVVDIETVRKASRKYDLKHFG